MPRLKPPPPPRRARPRRSSRRSAPASSTRRRSLPVRRAADWLLSGLVARERSSELPGWGSLNNAQARMAPQPQAQSFLERISTLKFGALLFIVAALCTGYVGHVHATQNLLAEVEAAHATQQTLLLRYNRLKGSYDLQTSPSIITRRAEALGLRHGLPRGPLLAPADRP